MTQPSAERLIVSPSLSYHEHHGAYYVYHNRVGYLLKMSHDVLRFIDAFGDPMTEAEAVTRFAATYPAAMVSEFVQVFRRHLCLLGEGEREEDSLWSMFPVRGRWLVYHEPADPAASIRLVRVGSRGEVYEEEIGGWRRRLWERIDGTNNLSALIAMLRSDPDIKGEGGFERLFLDTIARWVGFDLQAVRLSEYPASMMRVQPQLNQPYLTSVLPYPMVDIAAPAKPALEEQAEVNPLAYYRDGVADAGAQFDEVETTLSHLFRVPHPVLGGQTYGQRMAAALLERHNLPERLADVLEVGGGLGFFARDFLDALLAARPELAPGLEYRILDASPVLQEAQRRRLAGHRARLDFLLGDAAELDLPPCSVDLVLCNEMVGDLAGVRLTAADLGLHGAGEGTDGPEADPDGIFEGNEARLSALGSVGQQILEYELPLHDAPPVFFLNTGLFRFMERLWTVLRPGGVAVLTEFGEEHRYPQLSIHLDHPELSIHFAMARHVARRLGFDVEFCYIIDLLDFDRDQKTLGATRSSFRALQLLLRDFGVELDKVAYTRSMLEDALQGKVALGELGGLQWSPVEDRCMGLVPHQFKALILTKSATEDAPEV